MLLSQLVHPNLLQVSYNYFPQKYLILVYAGSIVNTSGTPGPPPPTDNSTGKFLCIGNNIIFLLILNSVDCCCKCGDTSPSSTSGDNFSELVTLL